MTSRAGTRCRPFELKRGKSEKRESEKNRMKDWEREKIFGIQLSGSLAITTQTSAAAPTAERQFSNRTEVRGPTDGQTDGQIDLAGWLDGWMDRCWSEEEEDIISEGALLVWPMFMGGRTD